MVQLTPGYPVYLYERGLIQARRTSVDHRTGQIDGTRLSRRLLQIFFTLQERRLGSIAKSPVAGLITLNATIIDSIVGWYSDIILH